MDRRQFLGGLASTFALSLTGCAAAGNATIPTPTPTVKYGPAPYPIPEYVPPITPRPLPPPVLTKIQRPNKTLYELPGEGSLMAWTVDDGASSETVAGYAKFAKESGIRLTFFMNGSYSSWSDNAAALRPLVESGQVQIGNHTYSHPWLTKISDSAIVNELQKNAKIIRDLFGVDAAPYYRPPYGAIDARVRSVASSIGYTAPVMWYGSLSDSGRITPEQVVDFADKWFLPQHIVIGHANFPSVTEVFPKLRLILAQRGLQTVTFNDVFL
ncbi:MAG: polysaccharide deacetylase family protein [Cryobacterium sp.]|nr:polysaccharide deacetylase family protein [Cryobacterium sp.]MBX3115881.1 polysaccharide deacetylase family protein [Cryobacterium sp.]MCO5294917.1 polysaccharide deacetylase family protein [Homoserinimonas sp.]